MSGLFGLGNLVSTAQNGVRALGEIVRVLDSITVASGAKYTVAGLPAVTAANQGLVAYATNGRNPGEGPGAGTGCLVTVNSVGVFAAVWSGVAVTA